jgi:transposase-like protein
MPSIEDELASLALQDSVNYAQTAREFGVDRSTLSRRHREVTRSRQELTESQMLLTRTLEEWLVDYINKLSKRSFPPTSQMVHNSAAEIAKKRGRKELGRPIR